MPTLNALRVAQDPFVVYLLCVLVLFLLSGYYALSAILKAELYPTHIRGLGVSLPYAIALAIFGGNAESTALYLKHIGMEAAYFWIVAGLFARLRRGEPHAGSATERAGAGTAEDGLDFHPGRHRPPSPAARCTARARRTPHVRFAARRLRLPAA